MHKNGYAVKAHTEKPQTAKKRELWMIYWYLNKNGY